MRPRGWMLRTMLLLALAPLALGAGDTGQTKWTLSDFTWVLRVPAEPGAATNAQPAQLSPETLQALLGSVKARVGGKDIPLFTRNELKDLAPALSEAFALAQPGEDLVLVSSSRRGRFARAEGLTARLFVQDGALNLIVHDARLAFMDRYLEDDVMPTFTYGMRKTTSATLLQAPQAKRLRPDWLAFPLVTVPTQVVAPAPVPVLAPAPVPAPTPALVPAPTPVAAVPVAAPVSAAPPRAAPEPAPAAREDAAYEAKAQRLRTLKRLRDENLITEAEYQERREAILKSL